MKCAAITIVLMAIGLTGCGDNEPEQTEATEETSAQAAAEAKRIMQAAPKTESPRSVGAPGFFGGGATRGRRIDDPDDTDDTDDDLLTMSSEPEKPKPVKRPPPKSVSPDEQAAKNVKLAKLYIANASTAATADKRKFLRDKAATILKEIISTRPQAPAATEAKILLKEIENAQ